MTPPIELTITQVKRSADAMIRVTGRGSFDAVGLASGYGHPTASQAKQLQRAYELDDGREIVDDSVLQSIGQDLLERIRHATKDSFEQLQRSAQRFERVVVEGDAYFHAVPWELITLSNEPTLQFAGLVRTPLNQRWHHNVAVRGEQLRVLVVTARAFGHGDAGGQRSVVGPLINDTFYSTNTPPLIDVLRGGDFESLVDRLSDEQESGRSYDIVHLDMHGSLSDSGAVVYFEQIENVDDPRPSIDAAARIGAHAVSADRLGAILRNFGVEAAVFNSCNSAAGSASGDTGNLAFHLVRAGLPAAIGMRRVISVDGAAFFCRELYERLAGAEEDPHPLTASVGKARRAMRRAARDGRLRLDESALPVLYISRTPNLRLRPPTDDRGAWHRTQLGQSVRSLELLSRIAPHSVRGRDLDERIIRQLLFGNTARFRRTASGTPTSHVRTISLTGMAGSGKTTLLHELSANWDRTNYVDRSILLDAGDLAAAEPPSTDSEAADLVERWLTNGVAATGRSPAAGSYDETADLLNSPEETLIVIDSADTVTSEPLQAALLRFLAHQHRSRNWMLVSSRVGPGWNDSLAPSAEFRMEGLDPASAWQLVHSVRGMIPTSDAGEAQRLADYLHNYPGPVTALFGALQADGTYFSIETLNRLFLTGADELLTAQGCEMFAEQVRNVQESFDKKLKPWAMFVGLPADIAESVLLDLVSDSSSDTPKAQVAALGDLGLLAQMGLAETSRVTDRQDQVHTVWRLHPAVTFHASSLLLEDERKPGSDIVEGWRALTQRTTANLVLRPWGTTVTALLPPTL